jgi:hypothetical protein
MAGGGEEPPYQGPHVAFGWWAITGMISQPHLEFIKVKELHCCSSWRIDLTVFDIFDIFLTPSGGSVSEHANQLLKETTIPWSSIIDVTDQPVMNVPTTCTFASSALYRLCCL